VLPGRSLFEWHITSTEESFGCLSLVSILFSLVAVSVGLIICTEESYGCLSVVSFVCCQVDFCATG